jgi:hypothetical protein
MDEIVRSLGVNIVPVVSIIGTFIFAAIAAIAQKEQKTREAELQLQFKRSLLEKYNDPDAIRGILELEDRRVRQKADERRVLGGTIVTVVGIALVVGMYLMTGGPTLSLPGLIVLGVGLALLLYPQIMEQLAPSRK